MQVAPTESRDAGGYTPFRIHHTQLDKVSATSSMLSDSSQGASSSAGTGQLCTCSSLVGCSSLQLQEQHLLAGNSSSNACRTAQDMFVLVLPRVDQEPAGTGADKQKSRQSLGAASDQHSARMWIHQVGNKRLSCSRHQQHPPPPSRPDSSMSCDRHQLGQTEQSHCSCFHVWHLPHIVSHIWHHTNAACTANLRLPRSSAARARSS